MHQYFMAEYPTNGTYVWLIIANVMDYDQQISYSFDSKEVETFKDVAISP